LGKLIAKSERFFKKLPGALRVFRCSKNSHQKTHSCFDKQKQNSSDGRLENWKSAMWGEMMRLVFD
jgi:hypothetical protein